MCTVPTLLFLVSALLRRHETTDSVTKTKRRLKTHLTFLLFVFSFRRGRNRRGHCGALLLQPVPRPLIGRPVRPSAEGGRRAASPSAPQLRDPAAAQLRRAVSCLAAAFQQTHERQRVVALPPLLFTQLLFLVVLLFLVAVPPPPQPPPLVQELDGDGGRRREEEDAQRDGAAEAERAEELLHASARQRPRAVAQRQSVQGGDPEEGEGLHLRSGRRRSQTSVQEGQAASEAGGAESAIGAAPQLMDQSQAVIFFS